MSITYQVMPIEKIEALRNLCNELMTFQKSKAQIKPQLFDSMNFDTRLLPSVKGAIYNYVIVAIDNRKIVGYAYSNISPKETYSNNFATFFDLSSVSRCNVGCLSQFYIKEEYRNKGIGSILFDMSIKWLNQFNDVEDHFIFVSNGNYEALEFYKRKNFIFSHEILDGFIYVLRNKI